MTLSAPLSALLDGEVQVSHSAYRKGLEFNLYSFLDHKQSNEYGLTFEHGICKTLRTSARFAAMML